MTNDDRACAYLEAMAEKAGGKDVRVYSKAKGVYIMHLKGKPQRSVQVKMDEKREEFNRKVRLLMEDAR